MTDICEHNYIHSETNKNKDIRVFGAPEWKRADKFYCEKCLKEQSEYKYECGREKPEWY